MSDTERNLTIRLLEHGGEGFPADVDLESTTDRYVGYYENQHGEQLIFIRERGTRPLLYHGDYEWHPVPALWPERRRYPGIGLAPWVTGELNINQGELLWLASCLDASGKLLDDKPALDGGPLDRLLMQGIDEVFQQQREHFDRRWSVRETALDRWKENRDTQPTEEEEHYAEGAILVVLGLNAKQRRPRRGVTKDVRERIRHEAEEVVREVQR